MREKWQKDVTGAKAVIEGNQVISYDREQRSISSYRIYDGKSVGIFAPGNRTDDEKGYEKAAENLKKKPRPYPYEPGAGVRTRDLTEDLPAGKELLELARECMKDITKNHPKFIFSGSFAVKKETEHRVNDVGMNYFNSDGEIVADLAYKQMDSRNEYDGSFYISLRSFDKSSLLQTADFYLSSYEHPIPMPDECMIAMSYYELLEPFHAALNGENIALGTSLFAGKLGQKIFSADFSLTDDISDGECWMDCFWDGDGCVRENDKLLLINRGILITGYADKQTAGKYGLSCTASAAIDYADIPGACCRNLVVAKSTKTIKELLGGHFCAIPVMMNGGGFDDRGNFTQPVQSALLFDGENVLGVLPPFTIFSNLFDMFGRNYVGVCADDSIGGKIALMLFKAQIAKD